MSKRRTAVAPTYLVAPTELLFRRRAFAARCCWQSTCSTSSICMLTTASAEYFPRFRLRVLPLHTNRPTARNSRYSSRCVLNRKEQGNIKHQISSIKGIKNYYKVYKYASVHIDLHSEIYVLWYTVQQYSPVSCGGLARPAQRPSTTRTPPAAWTEPRTFPNRLRCWIGSRRPPTLACRRCYLYCHCCYLRVRQTFPSSAAAASA